MGSGLPYKHEDLSLDPQYSCNRLDVAVGTLDSIPGGRDRRILGTLVTIANHIASGSMNYSVSKKIRYRETEEDI